MIIIIYIFILDSHSDSSTISTLVDLHLHQFEVHLKAQVEVVNNN